MPKQRKEKITKNHNDRPPNPHPKKGVKDWLLFLCLFLIIIVPLFAIYRIISDFIPVYKLLAIKLIPLIDIILYILLTIFSIFAGIMLLKRRNKAVKIAKIFLVCAIVYHALDVIRLLLGVLIFTIPFASSYPISFIRLIISFLGGIFAFVTWFVYLERSKRVKATYPSEVDDKSKKA